MPARNVKTTDCSSRPRAHLIRPALVAAVVAATALIAACGGSSSGGSSSSSGGGGGSGGSTVKAAKITGYGTALVTGSGKSVYLLSTDPSGGSNCAGACTKTWTPVTASGGPSAGSGASSSLLSTFKRKDGTTQVLYDKHALYTFSGTGATAGEGQASDGGVWYLVNPKGSAIKHSSQGGY